MKINCFYCKKKMNGVYVYDYDKIAGTSKIKLLDNHQYCKNCDKVTKIEVTEN